MNPPLVFILLGSFIISSCAGTAQSGRPSSDEPPAGVQQILPRGGIPAVFAPRFVSVAEASIPDDAWVLGVVVEGVAKAYSLNLLNRHEVVNDRSGNTDFAAVW